MKTSLSVVALAVALVALGVVLLGGKAPAQVTDLGGASGQHVSFHQFFHDNITVGGYSFATSSAGTATYTAASINNSRVIEHNATAALTATLPTNAALSAIGFLPSVGDSRVFFIHASTTLITLAGNTGVTLSSASTTKAISAGTTGRVECVRLGATEARSIKCLLIAD